MSPHLTLRSGGCRLSRVRVTRRGSPRSIPTSGWQKAHQPTLQDHKSITVTEDMASMTQQIHLSQVKATGTPTSHGAIMNNQDQHARPHDHDLLTIDEAAGILRTPKATLRYWRR